MSRLHLVCQELMRLLLLVKVLLMCRFFLPHLLLIAGLFLTKVLLMIHFLAVDLLLEVSLHGTDLLFLFQDLCFALLPDFFRLSVLLSQHINVQLTADI